MSAQTELWVIPHPGTWAPVFCSTFQECMDKWFEGFNLPIRCSWTELDTFDEAYNRVKSYLAKPPEHREKVEL